MGMRPIHVTSLGSPELSPDIHDAARLAFRFFGKDLSSQPATTHSTSPSRVSPLTRQLSTPEQPRCSSPSPELPYVDFLMSPAMGATLPLRDVVACPVQQSAFCRARRPLTPAFAITQSRQAVAAVSRLAGRNSVQMRTFLNPTVSRRGTFQHFHVLSPPRYHTCSHPSPGAAGGWIGVEESTSGRTLEIASRHDSTCLGRAFPFSYISFIVLIA